MKFIEIIIKAIKFDSSVYKLAKENKSYTKYSLFVVLVASLFTGVGTSIMTESSSIPKELISSLIGWILWSTVIYVLGTRILGYEATFTELLRTLGIAYSPGVMNNFGIINEISIFVI